MSAKIGTWRLRRTASCLWDILRRCPKNATVTGWVRLGEVQADTFDDRDGYWWVDLAGNTGLTYWTMGAALDSFKRELEQRKKARKGRAK